MPNILFICMGNICRSPAAHGIMKHLCHQHKLDWNIDSCGTDAYHRGASPDSRMQKTLQQHGIQFKHTAQLFQVGMAYNFDLLLAMDFRNYEDISEKLVRDPELQNGVPIGKLQLFRAYDPQSDLQGSDPQSSSSEQQGFYEGAEVPDPYYNGDKSFQEVYQMIWRTCNNLVAKFS